MTGMGWPSIQSATQAPHGHAGWPTAPLDAPKGQADSPPPGANAGVVASPLFSDKPKRLKLETSAHIRRQLAAVYREARSGKIELDQARCFTHILQALNRVIETSDIEGRLIALEDAKAEK